MVDMRRLLSALALSTVALALPMVAAPVGRATQGDPPTQFVFVSMPDTFNHDLGDVRDSPYWRRGDPNSINQEYRTVIQTVFADVAAENPLAVLMAGDAVQGHWGRDDADTGIFGPVRTDRQRTKAMRRAAHQYYGEYVERFDALPLPLYAAVGDHELGDNPWRAGDSAWRAWKLHHLRALRSEWAEKFTRSGTRFALHPENTSYDETAYATYLVPGELLLITMDVFKKVKRDVIVQAGKGQLDWMKGVLAEARTTGVDWIIVQGHTPVLTPVRKRHSSGLTYVGGRTSRFWTLMTRYGVDLYLNGEVHDDTTIAGRGPVQVSHGGLMRLGQSSYLRAEISGELMTLQTKRWDTERPVRMSSAIWQTDIRKSITRDKGVFFDPGSDHVVGGMSLTSDGLVSEPWGVMATDDTIPPSRRLPG